MKINQNFGITLLQTKEDQVVLELKKLKPSIDEIKTIEKSREKIAAFENQLATPVMNADQDETLQLTKGEKEFDTNIKSSLPKDTHVETANKNDNSNTNEDRAAQLKVIWILLIFYCHQHISP